MICTVKVTFGSIPYNANFVINTRKSNPIGSLRILFASRIFCLENITAKIKDKMIRSDKMRNSNEVS